MFSSSVLALAVCFPNRVTGNDQLIENRDVLSSLASHNSETRALSADDRHVVEYYRTMRIHWKFCTNPLSPMAEKLNQAPCLFARLGTSSCLLGSSLHVECSDMATLNLLDWEICIARLIYLSAHHGLGCAMWPVKACVLGHCVEPKLKIKGNLL
jgi:hypothetical protein